MRIVVYKDLKVDLLDTVFESGLKAMVYYE